MFVFFPILFYCLDVSIVIHPRPSQSYKSRVDGEFLKENHIPCQCGEWCPSTFNSFELPSWMLYQDVKLLWDSGLGRGESGYLL
jgi:hypothetical protein